MASRRTSQIVQKSEHFYFKYYFYFKYNVNVLTLSRLSVASRGIIHQIHDDAQLHVECKLLCPLAGLGHERYGL